MGTSVRDTVDLEESHCRANDRLASAVHSTSDGLRPRTRCEDNEQQGREQSNSAHLFSSLPQQSVILRLLAPFDGTRVLRVSTFI
jgi:hypothetical protein